MDSGLFFSICNAILLLAVALGFWGKLSKGLSFSKEWLDVAIVFIRAVLDGKIDPGEADEIVKEWEEAKNSGSLPPPTIMVKIRRLCR